MSCDVHVQRLHLRDGGAPSSSFNISESAFPGASDVSSGLPVVGGESFMSFFMNGTSLVSLVSR
jgi:hypothetical protein